MTVLLAHQPSALPDAAEEIHPQPRLWTRDEYYKMADAGILKPGERTELIDGEIILKMSPMKRPHAVAIGKVKQVLETAFGDACYVASQLPLTLNTGAEPEPDALVVAGEPDDYIDHPTPQEALLLVEVSDSTLSYDLGRKAGLYARAGITDYWVLDLKTRTLTVHRIPGSAGYGDVQIFAEEESVSPLSAPTASVPVSALLPRLRPAQT